MMGKDPRSAHNDGEGFKICSQGMGKDPNLLPRDGEGSKSAPNDGRGSKPAPSDGEGFPAPRSRAGEWSWFWLWLWGDPGSAAPSPSPCSWGGPGPAGKALIQAAGMQTPSLLGLGFGFGFFFFLLSYIPRSTQSEAPARKSLPGPAGIPPLCQTQSSNPSQRVFNGRTGGSDVHLLTGMSESVRPGPELKPLHGLKLRMGG